MRRSKYRRESSSTNWFSNRRRIIGAVATLVAFGGIVTVSQVSNASTTKKVSGAPTVNCPQVKINVAVPGQAKAEVGSNLKLLDAQIAEANKRLIDSQGQGGANFIQNAILNPLKDKRIATINRIETAIGRNAKKPNLNAQGLSACTLNQGGGNNNANGGNNNANGGKNNGGNANGGNANGGNANGGNNNGGNNNGGNNNGGNNGKGDANNAGKVGTAGVAGNGATTSDAGKIVNGNVILTDTCVDSKLQAADGFQKGNTCVSTEFGEVASAANDPSLLITQAPLSVKQNTPFTLKVSTRNLQRDRFLGAAAGGYYVESSVLQNGIVRGHFHTACRSLPNTNEAPTPEGVPAFFVATEDKKGGKTPDTVTIQVPGLPDKGVAQCTSWAGDGSHRVPMMERANQTPAIDSVKIQVR